MIRSRALWLVAALFLPFVGCANPDRDRTRLEFERLRQHPTTPEEDKILPDFGTDFWTEEALRPGGIDYSRISVFWM